MTSLPLRDYQQAAVDAARAACVRGARAICLVAPTGSGKTRIGVAIAQGALAQGGRLLWLAHRRELVAQAANRLYAEGIHDFGVVLASGIHGNPNAPALVASIQTLLARDFRPTADVVIFDEAHHYVAAEWSAFAQHYAGAVRIGLTATPERADRTPLGNLFDTLIPIASVPDLTARGLLVPIDVIAPPKRLDEGLAQDPVGAWHKHALGRRTVAFCANVDHARELAESFSARGVPAACVDSRMSADERERAIGAFWTGRVTVLTNVYVLTEGWDMPAAEVCLLARGCGAASTFLQMVGRVLRPADGKARALLLDLCGIVHEHGLPDDPREYSLSGRAIRSAAKLPPIRQCRACGAVFRPVATCPMCGTALPPPAKPTVRDVPLDRVQSVVGREEKQRVFDQLVAIQRARGYKFGWVGVQFRQTFGHWPVSFRTDEPGSRAFGAGR